MFGFSGGYPSAYAQPSYGGYGNPRQGFSQGMGGRGTSLEGIASLVGMFSQMSPEQFDTGIARLTQFKDVYGSGGFGNMGGNTSSMQGLFGGSPSMSINSFSPQNSFGGFSPNRSNFRQPTNLGMPFGNSIRQGSVNTQTGRPDFLASSPNPLFANAGLIGPGVTRTLSGPEGQSMQVLANDPRFIGKSENEVQKMVFGGSTGGVNSISNYAPNAPVWVPQSVLAQEMGNMGNMGNTTGRQSNMGNTTGILSSINASQAQQGGQQPGNTGITGGFF